MPRFYFHLHDGEDRRDQLGTDHADFETARANAVRLLGERMVSNPERFDQDAYWNLEVASDEGLTLTVLHLSEISAPAAARVR